MAASRRRTAQAPATSTLTAGIPTGRSIAVSAGRAQTHRPLRRLGSHIVLADAVEAPSARRTVHTRLRGPEPNSERDDLVSTGVGEQAAQEAVVGGVA